MSNSRTIGNKSMIMYVLIWLVRESLSNVLFISLAVQLYIPGQHYSLLTMAYDISGVQNKLFNIDISLQLNQVHAV